jgi:chromosome segregation ATPase
MKPRTSSDFKFRMDEDRPDSIFQEEMENLRLDKLNRRITFVSIFVPILMVLIMTYGYLEIKKKFVRSDNSGAEKVQILATDLESKFSSLSLKYAKLEESLNNSISPINEIFLEFEKSTTGLKKDLQKLDQSVVDLETEKAGKKALTDLLTAVGSKLGPLRADIKKNSTDRQIENEKLRYSLDEIAGKAEINGNSMINFEEDIATLSSAMTNNKMVILGLKTDLQSYRETLTQTIKQIEDTLVSVRKKLDEMQQVAPVVQHLQPAASESQPAVAAPESQSAPTEGNVSVQAATPPPAPPEPGIIVEQDIE